MKAINKRPGDRLKRCPICAKSVQERGFNGHVRFSHWNSKEGQALLSKRSAKAIARAELNRIRAEEEALEEAKKNPALFVHRASPMTTEKGEEESDEAPGRELRCPGCRLELEEVAADEHFCPYCGTRLTDEEAWDEEEAEGEEVEEEEVEEEEAEKSDADKAADLFLKMDAVIKSVRAACEKQGAVARWLEGRCVGDILVRDLEAVRDGEIVDDKVIEKLLARSARIVVVRKKVLALREADADAAASLIKGLLDEEASMRVELLAEAEAEEARGGRKGFWRWL